MEVAIRSRDLDRRALLVGLEGRVHEMRQSPEQREVGQRGDEAAGEDDLFPADAVGQGAEDQEERRAENQRQANQEVRRDEVELQVDEDEEQRVELAGVPDDALPGRRTQ